MSEMDELFGKIGAAAANGKGDNFKDGKGVVVVRELLCKRLNEGNTFIGCYKVVSSASKGDTDAVTKLPVEPNAVGTNPSWPQKLDKFKSAPGNVKGHVLALLGFAESAVTPTQFAEALGRLIAKEQPGRGMLIGYETYQQPTRSGPNIGKVNTYVRWLHVPPSAGNSAKEIAERRAELDKTDPLSQ